MTDIQKQLAEALDAVDKNAVKHCATEYSIDRETLLKVHQALAAHRQQEARGPLTEEQWVDAICVYAGWGKRGWKSEKYGSGIDCIRTDDGFIGTNEVRIIVDAVLNKLSQDAAHGIKGD